MRQSPYRLKFFYQLIFHYGKEKSKYFINLAIVQFTETLLLLKSVMVQDIFIIKFKFD